MPPFENFIRSPSSRILFWFIRNNFKRVLPLCRIFWILWSSFLSLSIYLYCILSSHLQCMHSSEILLTRLHSWLNQFYASLYFLFNIFKRHILIPCCIIFHNFSMTWFSHLPLYIQEAILSSIQHTILFSYGNLLKHVYY